MKACSAAWQERLSARFDGEIDAREARAVAAHIDACTACAEVLEAFGVLRAGLRSEAARAEGIPPALEARLEQLVPRRRPALSRRRVLGAIAAAAAILGMAWGTWPGGMNEALALDLERHHLKAFSRASPCEFESDDPAAVEAWIREQVGYEVKVPTLPGATLLGARRCRLYGEVSASVLYRLGDRALTLFLPPEGSSASKLASSFAEDAPRCTMGPVGERICVAAPAGSGITVLAVSEVEEPTLLQALAVSAR